MKGMKQMTELTQADLIHDGVHEPRMPDIRVAERLGFAKATDIRKLIKRNEKELLTYGPLLRREVQTGLRHGGVNLGGRPSLGYLLNEAQILLTAMKSDAPAAPAIRKEVIDVYQAWRRGQVGPMPAGLVELLAALEARHEDRLNRLRLEFNRIAENYDGTGERLTTFMRTTEILDKAGIPQKGRKGLAARCTKLMLRMAVQEKRFHEVGTSKETGKYQFHVNLAGDWVRGSGAGVLRAHKDKVMGQGDVFDYDAEKAKRGK